MAPRSARVSRATSERVIRPDELSFVLQRLSQRAVLAPSDIELAKRALTRVRRYEKHQPIPNLEDLRQPALVVSGWASLSKTLPNARRQLIDLFVPGDLVGIKAQHMASGQSITDLSLVDAMELVSAVQATPDSYPGLNAALRCLREEANTRLIRQVIRIGRMSTYERIADLCQEILVRLALDGVRSGNEVEVPLSQDEFANLLGLSIVHFNRTLKQLGDDGVLTFRRKQLHILDLQRLAALTKEATP